jgi:hypothetical protein
LRIASLAPLPLRDRPVHTLFTIGKQLALVILMSTSPCLASSASETNPGFQILKTKVDQFSFFHL